MFSVNPSSYAISIHVTWRKLTDFTNSGIASGSRLGWLAELASFQMEYKYLAKLTGRKEYYDVVSEVNNMVLHCLSTSSFYRLRGSQINLTRQTFRSAQQGCCQLYGALTKGCQWAVRSKIMMRIYSSTTYAAQISVGAMADSGYEYILKQWILTNFTELDNLQSCALGFLSLF